VKDSVVDLTFFMVAENCPVLFMLLSSPCCRFRDVAAAAAPPLAMLVWKAEICRCRFLILAKAAVVSISTLILALASSAIR
jgi:hypothetical protein